MSEYYESLNSEDKVKYRNKLESVGLDIKDDPYCEENGDKFTTSMSIWPRVEYGHIFCYFIERPGVYTQEQLLSWKQLDSYNYFQSGYVREVVCCVFGKDNHRIIKSRVNPSQNSPDKAHKVWIVLQEDGVIVTGHCTCKAGLGEGCSHIAAVLFKLECAVRLGYTSVTAESCKWNETYCSKVVPAHIVDIAFYRPVRGKEQPQRIENQPIQQVAQVTDNETTAFYDKLKQVMPDSAILTTLEPIQRPTTQSIRKLPILLTSLYNPKYELMSKDELLSRCREVFQNDVKISEEEASYLEESTKMQHKSIIWKQHRIGRLTASNFGRVCRAKLRPPPFSLVKELMNTSNLSKVPQIQWGNTHESVARDAYMSSESPKHDALTCTPSGLHINPQWPHLGASPDGLISCKCCGDGLLEIKCPYKYKDTNPDEVIDKAFCLQPNQSGGMSLSTTHHYYYQVQGQLGICKRDYCDFVCWTEKGMHIERIELDECFFQLIKPALDKFFEKVMLPRLLGGNKALENFYSTNELEIICWCQTEEAGDMVACDNPLCTIEWFHFYCAGLTRKPRGLWFCSDECEVASKELGIHS